MAGIGDSWGTREELLHPRDKHGRFRSKWKMAAGVVDKILAALSAFSPRQFQSDGQASQYLHNKAKPSRFGGGNGYGRLSADFDAANDALRAGTMDASTQKFVKMMDDSAIDLPDDIIVSRRVGPEAFGLTPETMGLDQGGIEDFTGKLIADRGYTSSNIGTPVGTAPIQISIAVPKGTKAIIPGRSQNDRQVYLDRDQEIRVTKVDPDGRGGFYVLAVAQPRTPGETPEPIGGPGAPGDATAREGQVERARQLGLQGMKVPEGEAPQHGTTRQRQEQGLAPNPADIQGPVDTGPGGPPPRNEPVVTEALGQSGAPQAPAAPAGAPEVPGGAPETPIREADFKEAAAALPIPSAGKRRREWNAAYLGVRAGKRDPDDILRELNKDIEVNKGTLADQKSRGDVSDPQLEEDIAAQEKLSELIGRHHDIDGKTSEEAAPAAPEPVKAAKKAAPAKAIPAKKATPSAPAKKATAPVAKKATPPAPVKKVAPAPEVTDREEEVRAFMGASRKPSMAQLRAFAEQNDIQFDPKDSRGELINTILGAKPRRGLGTRPTPVKKAVPVKRTGTFGERIRARQVFTDQGIENPTPDQIDQQVEDNRIIDRLEAQRPFHEGVARLEAELRGPKKAAPKKSIEGASPGTAAGKITSLRLTPGTTVLIHKDSAGAWRPTTRKTGATKLKVTGNDALSGRGGRRQISGTGPDGEEIKIDVAPVQTFIVDQPKVTPTKAAAPSVPETVAAPDIEKMTKPELIAEAKRRGVDIRPSWNKDKIKEAIGLREARSRAIFPQGFEGLEQMRQDVRVEQGDGLNVTVRELQSIADSEGVPRRGRPKTKADLQNAIRARREEKANLTRREAPPVVANPVAQKPIQAPDRASDFRLAWAREGGFKETGAAGRSIDEIRDDIGSGKITPDEGIRRMESEIELNKADLAEMDADLRGDMGDEQKHMLKQKRDALAKATRTQEKASTFLRTHFKKEPAATPDEVLPGLDEAGKRALDDATPEGIREAALAQGIKVKGETKDEILKDLVRQMAGKELERRAAKKAPAPKAPDKVKPNLEMSPYQRIDTQALAEGLDLRTEWDQRMMKRVQEQLDGTDTSLGKNPTPAQIGRNLESWANGPAGPFYESATMQVTREDKRDAAWHAKHDAFRAQGQEWLKLADRLKNTRRRKKEDRAPDVTPTVTRDEKKDIAAVAEVTGIPAPQLEARALAKKKAEAPPKQSAVQVAETLKTVGSREEATTLLQGRTKADLQEIMKAAGFEPGPGSRGARGTKPNLIADIVEGTVGNRLSQEAIGGMAGEIFGPKGGSKHTRADLEDMSLADLVDLEDELGIQRASLNRGDRIDAILAKQAGPSVPDVTPAAPTEELGSTARHVAALDKMNTQAEVDDYLAKIKGAELDELARHFDVDKKSALGKRTEISTAIGFRITRPGQMGSSMGRAAAAPTAKPAGVALRRSREVSTGPNGLTAIRDRPGNDEAVYLPNGGRDQGAMHFDSEMGQLWKDLYMDDREPNSFVNEIARMGDRMGYTRGDADLERDVIPLLEKLKGQASDSAVADRIQGTIDKLSAPPVAVPDLPEGVPAPIRAAMEQLSKIPTARKKGRIGAALVKETILDKKAKLIRDFVAGDVPYRDFQRRLEARDLHESADGAFRMWAIFERLFNREPIVGYRQGPNGKMEPITELNPDFDVVRDWIRATRRQ